MKLAVHTINIKDTVDDSSETGFNHIQSKHEKDF